MVSWLYFAGLVGDSAERKGAEQIKVCSVTMKKCQFSSPNV
jgi:hypothetical protein